MYINIATTKDDKRVYDKKNSCYYCSKEYPKIARHLQHVHGKQSEVAEALGFKKGRLERKKQLEKLRLMGNFLHNMKVLEIQDGELKVFRRPTAENRGDPNDYLPCKYCHGFVKKQDLWRHAKTCQFCTDEESMTKNKNLKYAGRLLLAANKFPKGCSKQLSEEVIGGMIDDQISQVVQSDETILLYGSTLLEKLGKNRANNVSQEMRQLGRLLVVAREKTGVPDAKMQHLLDGESI